MPCTDAPIVQLADLLPVAQHTQTCSCHLHWLRLYMRVHLTLRSTVTTCAPCTLCRSSRAFSSHKSAHTYPEQEADLENAAQDACMVQVKPVYTYVHSQHHQIGSAISALGTAFGDALDIGLCFVAFHLVLGLYLSYQPSWNIAAVVLLIIFEVWLPSTVALSLQPFYVKDPGQEGVHSID